MQVSPEGWRALRCQIDAWRSCGFCRAGIGSGSPDQSSIRPPATSYESDGDSGVLPDQRGHAGHRLKLRQEELSEPRAVLPVRDTDGVGEINEDELVCQPCGEEEQADVPGLLPSVYQPTRSEYLDHCVSHFPFRAWCRHCLEGRGREFGHSNTQGVKDEKSTPVVFF